MTDMKFDSPITKLIAKMRVHEAELEQELTRVRVMLAAAEGRTTHNTTDLILEVLRDDPLRGDWPVHELTEAIKTHGWSTTSGDPVNAVRSAMVRLMDQGTVRRVRPGVYALQQEDQS